MCRREGGGEGEGEGRGSGLKEGWEEVVCVDRRRIG